MTAQIVVGLGFGDEGKGITTDYLCSQNLNSIVVRFSGGQQAGHTVMLNGIKHIHSSFGSGTLRGLPSYFSEHCCIYFNTMLREYKVLQSKGVTPQLYIHPLAKLTTPYDIAYNRIMESKQNHGSCGLGIGATMKRHNESGFKLFAVDTLCPAIFVEKLKNIMLYYNGLIKEDADRRVFDKIIDVEFNDFVKLALDKSIKISVHAYDFLQNFKNIIFEGSQGILLDMHHGVFPNVTYAETTSKNAIEICNKIGVYPEMFYVTRCYQTRHGNGFMSNEFPIQLVNNKEEINIYNQWQGNFRIGELDYSLLNHSLFVDHAHSYIYPKNLVVTCMDQRPGFIFDESELGLPFKNIYYSLSPESNSIYVKRKSKSISDCTTSDRMLK